jgi:U3 small nucleolar RNA-associated protein 23
MDLGQENKFNYCVASLDVALRQQLRNVPGVPLMYIRRSVLIMEPPSSVTLEHAKKVSNDCLYMLTCS